MHRIDIRCNRYSIEPASDGQEFDQFFQSFRARVTQLLAMHPLNRLAQTVEKGESEGRHVRDYCPPVLSPPRDQLSLLKTL